MKILALSPCFFCTSLAIILFSGCSTIDSGLSPKFGSAELQRQIDALPEGGGVVIIEKGEYVFDKPLVLKSGTKIRGHCDATVLSPASESCGVLLTNSDWIKGNEGIEISDLVLNGASDRFSLGKNNYHKRAYAKSSDDLENVAIYFQNLRSSSIHDLKIANFRNEALMLSKCSKISVWNNGIENCSQKAHVNDWAQGAIYLRHSSDCEIRRNRISNCYEGGIVAGFESNSNFISENTMSNCASGEGVFIGCGSGNIVSGNTIADVSHADLGSGAGIAVSVPPSIDKSKSPAKNNLIVGNTVSNTGGSGISLFKADENMVLSNDVSRANENGKPGRGGISVYESEGNSIVGNTVSDCNCPAVSVQKSQSFAIRGNTLTGNHAPLLSLPSDADASNKVWDNQSSEN